MATLQEILKQDNYKFEKGKLFYLDMFGDWKEKVPDRFGKVQLKMEGEKPLPFFWSEVQEIFSSKDVDDNLPVKTNFMTEGKPMGNILVDERTGEVTRIGKVKSFTETELGNQLINAARGRGEFGINEDELPKRTAIRSAEIKMIRNMLAEDKTPTEIAKAINKTLHSVMYIVKQIKSGKKLKWEK